MKKSSFVGLACIGTIATTLVFSQPTIATEKPALTMIQATNQATSTQIATSNYATEQSDLGVQKPARRKPYTPFEIFVGVIVVGLGGAAVIFKQQMGNWTVRQVSNLLERMNLERLDRD